MKFSPIFVPGQSEMARAVRQLSRFVEVGFEDLGALWSDVSNDEVSKTISPNYVLAAISVPRPPEGCEILVEGWCNAYYGAGALTGDLSIKVGSISIATASIKSATNSESTHVKLAARYSTQSDTNFRLQFDYTSGLTTATFMNRGLVARYVKEE